MNAIKKLVLFISMCCSKVAFTQTIPPPPPIDSIAVDDKIFTKAEVEAEFPGGNQGWIKFLTKTLNTEVPGKNGAPAGAYTVIVKFIVRKDGTISDVNSESYVGYGTDEEVIRTIKASGKWTPAVPRANRACISSGSTRSTLRCSKP